MGILAVLHTWSRTLEYHPHAHLLVTAGGLAPNGATWKKPTHARFLMPGYALSPRFRAKMRGAITRAGLPDQIDPRTWRRRWTVHVQPIGTGQHAALDLSRYIYRVALTNHRLEQFAHGHVTVRYTHARTAEARRLTLPTDRFLARFLQHVLPRGFPKVRAYGLLRPSRKPDLERARAVLLVHAAAVQTSRGSSSAPAASRPIAPPHDLLRVWLVLALALRCPVCRQGQQVLQPFLRSTPSRAPP